MHSENRKYGFMVAGLIATWFVFVFTLSARSVFVQGPASFPVPRVGFALLFPIVVFVSWFAASPAFRKYALSLDVGTLTFLQSWRVVGFAFLALATFGILPNIFALPAGWGDVAIGLTAPLAALHLAKPGRSFLLIVWQILGIVDLITAVSLGVLASPAVHLFGETLTTAPLAFLPLSLIPTFGVPLALIFHFLCIAQIAGQKSQ